MPHPSAADPTGRNQRRRWHARHQGPEKIKFNKVPVRHIVGRCLMRVPDSNLGSTTKEKEKKKECILIEFGMCRQRFEPTVY